jgi:hypothetical protein
MVMGKKKIPVTFSNRFDLPFVIINFSWQQLIWACKQNTALQIGIGMVLCS